ncbi:RNA-splicing factor [Salix suchowensis]|nr:RNA-splicing factor [Salix suchowensis]
MENMTARRPDKNLALLPTVLIYRSHVQWHWIDDTPWKVSRHYSWLVFRLNKASKCSGTNGYVVRNLSTLRSHQSSQDRASAWDVAPPKHREPDEGILEHERKRKVEVKCLELQLELEDKGVEEEQIEEQVSALRTKLLANLSSLEASAKSLKASDTHGLAAAKKSELSKMARALGTRTDYVEGDAFDREKQEENRQKRMVEREEREKRSKEERAKMEEQKAKWEAEKRERES